MSGIQTERASERVASASPRSPTTRIVERRSAVTPCPLATANSRSRTSGPGGLANLAEYEAVRRGQRSDAVVDARFGGAWHDEKGVAGQILEPSPLSEGDAMCD